MATIPINDKYQIGSDKRSWFIQERRNKKGGFYWEPVAWYGSIEQALANLGNRMVRESSAQGIGKLLDEAERVSSTLSRALTRKKAEIEGLDLHVPETNLFDEVASDEK